MRLVELRLGRAQRRLGLVVVAARGVAAGQKILLALEGGRRLPQPGLGRGDAGLGRDQLGLLLVGIEPGQHLVQHDMVADIDQALADLAAQAKRQVGAHLRGDHAGQGDGRREIDDFRGHDLDPGDRHHLGRVLLAAGEDDEADKPANCRRSKDPPAPRFARCYQVRHDRAMPTIKRLSFIGLEYAFAPEKAYGMSRGGGFRRQGGLVEVLTDAGVLGIGEAFGNPLVTRLNISAWSSRCSWAGACSTSTMSRRACATRCITWASATSSPPAWPASTSRSGTPSRAASACGSAT